MIEVVRHTIRVTVLVMHKGSPGRWPVGREVVMEDILIVRLLEIEEEGVGPAGATRPALAAYFCVVPSRVTKLTEEPLKRRWVATRLMKVDRTGRRQRVFVLTPSGIEQARAIRARLLSRPVRWDDKLGVLNELMRQKDVRLLTGALKQVDFIRIPAFDDPLRTPAESSEDAGGEESGTR